MDIYMKFKAASLSFLLLTFSAFSYAHYEAGDCITPTETGYSWFGHVAKVIAFSEIDGYVGKNYILHFPKYKSGDVIFTTEIEIKTKKIPNYYCDNS